MYKKSWKYMNKEKPSAEKESAPEAAPVSIPRLDIVVDPTDYENGLKDVLKHIRPQWNVDDIKFKTLQGGHVNLMLTAFVDENKRGDWLVLRVFSVKLGEANADMFGLDRNFEFKSGQLFSDIGAGPPLVGTFKNGMVYGFVVGRSFTWEDAGSSPLRDLKIRKSMARSLAKVHCQQTYKLAVEKYGFDKAPVAYDMMKGMGANDWGDALLVDEETTKWFNSQVLPFRARQVELSMIIEKMRTASIPTTFCHVDCNPTNIIYQEEEDRVVFVDLEACGLCNPIQDTSNFLDGAGSAFDGDPTQRGFTREENKEFMRAYLAERNRLDKGSEEVDEKELEKYLDINEMYMIGTSFMVHMMVAGLVGAGAPKTYLEAGIGRLQHYTKYRERMLLLWC